MKSDQNLSFCLLILENSNRMFINLFWQELDPPKAVDLETAAKIKVPSIINQPNLNNDQDTVRTENKTGNSCYMDGHAIA